MLTNPTVLSSALQPLQQLADARRVLEIDSDSPFLGPQARRDIRVAKRAAWQVLADVTEQLVATLDVAAGDPDPERNGDEQDGSVGAEDEFGGGNGGWNAGPGCPISDPDCAADDFGCDGEEGL